MIDTPAVQAPVPGARLRRRHIVSGVASSALSLVLLFLLLRHTDWREVGALLRQARPGWLLLGMGGVVLTVVGRALVWRVLLWPSGPLSVWTVTRALVLGLTINNLLPARMGEPFRAGVIAREQKRSLVTVLAAVLAETLATGVLLVTMGTIALARSGSLPWFDRAAKPLLAACLLVLVALSILARRPQPAVSGRLGALLGRMREGSLALARPLAVVRMLVWATLSFTGQLILLTAVQRSLGLAQPLHAIVVTVVAMNLAGALPSAPAALGTLELGALGALALYQVPRSLAVSTTLLFHTLVTVPTTAVGVVLLTRMGIRWRPRPG